MGVENITKILPVYPDKKMMQGIVPIKLYEYEAADKPVITTKLPCTVKEFGNGNVVVYIDKPEDAISKTIELIESGNIKEKRKKARKFVEKYSWDNTLDEFDGGLDEQERRK